MQIEDEISSLFDEKPENSITPKRPPRQDDRKNERYLVHWKIAVVYELVAGESKRFYGKTFDVSLSGASIYSDHNIFVEGPITVLMSVPAPEDQKKNKMLEIKARMTYTYLCSNRHRFRTGIRFLDFKGNGKSILQAVLAMKVPAGNNMK